MYMYVGFSTKENSRKGLHSIGKENHIFIQVHVHIHHNVYWDVIMKYEY
jgi:hypothetical protein